MRSLKEKWEQNGKGIHEGYGQSYGNGKRTLNPPTPAKIISESLASRRGCLRGFWTNF